MPKTSAASRALSLCLAAALLTTAPGLQASAAAANVVRGIVPISAAPVLLAPIAAVPLDGAPMPALDAAPPMIGPSASAAETPAAGPEAPSLGVAAGFYGFPAAASFEPPSSTQSALTVATRRAKARVSLREIFAFFRNMEGLRARISERATNRELTPTFATFTKMRSSWPTNSLR